MLSREDLASWYFSAFRSISASPNVSSCSASRACSLCSFAFAVASSDSKAEALVMAFETSSCFEPNNAASSINSLFLASSARYRSAFSMTVCSVSRIVRQFLIISAWATLFCPVVVFFTVNDEIDSDSLLHRSWASCKESSSSFLSSRSFVISLAFSAFICRFDFACSISPAGSP